MSTIRSWLALGLGTCGAAWLALAQPAEPPPPPPPPRVITVEVTVEAPEGTPVVGLPVTLHMSNPFVAAVTDSTGKATVTGTFPAGTTKIHAGIALQSTPYARSGSAEEWRVAEATNKAFHFKTANAIPLTQENAYTLRLVGTPAITLTGKFAWTLPGTPRGVVVRKDYPDTFSVNIAHEAEFDIGGIPLGEPIDLFVVWKCCQTIQIINLTAAQTQASGSLGELPSPSFATGRRASISMTNMTPLAPTPERPFNHNKVAMLVRSDGLVVFGSVVLPNGTLRGIEHTDELLRLPPGTYFFSPGGPDGYSQSIRLYDLLKAGRLAAVEAAGVPKLVVPEGGETDPIITFSFDAVQAENAIKAIP